MGKLGGLAVIVAAAVSLSACTASAVEVEPSPKALTKSGQVFEHPENIQVKQDAMAGFVAKVRTIAGYERVTIQNSGTMARDLCEHYAGGFTTEDLRATNAKLFGAASGDALARVGEAAKDTICAS